MQPNSISHRLFAAALSQDGGAPLKRPARVAEKTVIKTAAPKVSPALNAAARKISEWSWSGWQHTTI